MARALRRLARAGETNGGLLEQAAAAGEEFSIDPKMGVAGDHMAVVDSRFRVFGTEGLRIVDASVFPRIPGLFIVVPIYIIAEKASEVILADAGG
jgi:choline dehydrogenase